MKYRGIAISGGKAAGKDTAMEYLVRRFNEYVCLLNNPRILRSKMPMVQAFERATGKSYSKTLDAELMAFSIEERRRNPHIVADYLWRNCCKAAPFEVEDHPFTIIPDIRFIKENDVMLNNCAYFCLQVAADETLRLKRIIEREGSGHNFNPLDPTEIEIPLMRFHYVVTNDREPVHLFNQLDIVLERYFGDYGF